MKYAVVESGGKQYRVSTGDTIEVDRLRVVKDEEIIFDKVLLLQNEGTVLLGKPYVSEVKVIGRILDQTKGDKLRIAKFKSKVRHRRVTGFRAALTSIQIVSILGKGEKEVKAVKEEVKEKQEKVVRKKKTS